MTSPDRRQTRRGARISGLGPCLVSPRTPPRNGLHGSDHVPDMRRDESDLANLDPQTIRCHAVRLGRRLQPLDGILEEPLIEVLKQARVADLGVGHALRRVRRRGQTQSRVAQTPQVLLDLRMRLQLLYATRYPLPTLV